MTCKQQEAMLELDDIDQHFTAATKTKPTDLVFISKHASASGAPALTVSEPYKNLILNPKPYQGLKPKPETLNPES